MRTFGYALRGITPIAAHHVLNREQQINAIAALASSGVVVVDLVLGTVSGSDFLCPLRIINFKHGVFLWHQSLLHCDCSVHHIAKV